MAEKKKQKPAAFAQEKKTSTGEIPKKANEGKGKKSAAYQPRDADTTSGHDVQRSKNTKKYQKADASGQNVQKSKGAEAGEKSKRDFTQPDNTFSEEAGEEQGKKYSSDDYRHRDTYHPSQKKGRYQRREIKSRERVKQSDFEQDFQTKDTTFTGEAEPEFHGSKKLDRLQKKDNLVSFIEKIRSSLKNAGKEKGDWDALQYASLGTLAFRAANIPARYVEGYEAVTSDEKDANGNYRADVTGQNAHACEAEHGVKLKEIEYGPGLSVDYFVTDKCDAMNTDFDELKEFAVMIKEMSEKFNVTLEMGRYIAATCGVLISRIADMKMNDTTRYAIIDSGINHINYYGQAMAMKKPRCEFIPMEYTEGFADGADHEVEVYSQGVQPYNICGSLCTVGDVIVKNLELKDAKIGDMIAFYNIGAYSVTEGIYLFLSRRMPAIVMYSKKNGYRVIRKPIETFLINSSNTQ